MKPRVVKVAGEAVDVQELVRVCRRLGNHSELLRALFTAGEFHEVVALCRGPLRNDPYYETLALARALFILGEYSASLEEWERYGVQRWTRASASDLGIFSCTSSSSSLALDARRFVTEPRQPPLTTYVVESSFYTCQKTSSNLSLCPSLLTGPFKLLHSKRDCLAALVCLREVLGRNRLDLEDEVFRQYPVVYVSVLQNLHSWHSAISLLDAKYATSEGVARLQENLAKSFPPGTTPRMLEEQTLKLSPAGEKDYRRFLRIMNCIYRLWRQGEFYSAAELAQRAYQDDAPRLLIPGDSAFKFSAAYLHSLLLAGDLQAYVDARRNGFPALHHGPRLCDPYLNALLLAGEKLRPVDLLYNYGVFIPGLPDADREYFHSKLDEFEKRMGKDVLRYVVHRHSDAVYPQDRALSLLFALICRYNPHDLDYTIPAERGFHWEVYGQLREALRLSPLRHWQIKMYRIIAQPEFARFKKDLIGADARELSNLVRSFAGIPLVGEGWVSQQAIFMALKSGFAPLEVIAEASPPFLGGLRYDVYVPALRLAVEYQGIQHFEPVECFGGEEGLRRTRERDELKARLSQQNGVTVEYIRYDEDIQQRCQDIIAKYQRT